MKKLTALIIALVVVCQFGLQAQTYKQNKQVYNHRELLNSPLTPTILLLRVSHRF